MSASQEQRKIRDDSVEIHDLRNVIRFTLAKFNVIPVADLTEGQHRALTACRDVLANRNGDTSWLTKE